MREQIVFTKAVVTVSEMARMVGLSRARFHELVEAGFFPSPVYCVTTRRPMYVEELQTTCLNVRRKNLGVNGKPVLFYARGHRDHDTRYQAVEAGEHQTETDRCPHRLDRRPDHARAVRHPRPGR